LTVFLNLILSVFIYILIDCKNWCLVTVFGSVLYKNIPGAADLPFFMTHKILLQCNTYSSYKPGSCTKHLCTADQHAWCCPFVGCHVAVLHLIHVSKVYVCTTNSRFASIEEIWLPEPVGCLQVRFHKTQSSELCMNDGLTIFVAV
jgi:hypothetical protein